MPSIEYEQSPKRGYDIIEGIRNLEKLCDSLKFKQLKEKTKSKRYKK